MTPPLFACGYAAFSQDNDRDGLEDEDPTSAKD
jgi:hypothetical protein